MITAKVTHEGYAETQPAAEPSGHRSSRLSKILGGATLALASLLLLLILIPAFIPLLLAWCVVEFFYWLLRTRPTAQQLNAQPPEGHCPAMADTDDGLDAFRRFVKYCNEAPGRVDYKKYLSGWFLGAPYSEIKRQNIEEFVAYGFCYKTREQLEAEGRGGLPKQMVDELQQVWKFECPPGYNPDIKFMAHLWEPLAPSYRPLAFYLMIELVAYCSSQHLKSKGFEAHKHAGLKYYTLHLEKPPRTAGTQQAAKQVANAPAAGAAGPAAAAGASPHKPPRYLSLAEAGNAPAGGPKSPLSRFGPAAPPSPQRAAAAAGADAAGEASAAPAVGRLDSSSQRQQPSLLSILEQPLGPQIQKQQEQQHGDVAQNVQHSKVSYSNGQAASPALLMSTSSQLTDSDLALLESPFAFAASSQDFQAEDQPIPLSPPAARTAAAGAPNRQVPRSPGSARVWDTTQAAAGLGSRGTIKPSPLQAALSMALTEAGILEAGVPVVFLHGIGGLPAYLELLQYLEAEGSPLLAVEVKSVAMRLGPVYSVAEVAAAVLGMMDKMRVGKACFVAHSYGTFVASYIAKHHRQRMRGCVLIDPVCLGMFMPNLIYNFLYKQPVWKGWGKQQLVTYAKARVRSIISREVHVRASVARRFYWTELNAWPEDLPAGSTILLSGKDDLMDSPEVAVMLRSAKHLKVHNNENLTHGAFLLNKEVKQAIRAEVRALLASSGSAMMGLAQQLSVLVQPAATAGAGLQSRASSVVRSALRRVQSVHQGSGRRSSSGDGSKSPEGAAAGRHRRGPSKSFTEGLGVELKSSQQQLSAAGSSLGTAKSLGADAAAAADRKL